MEIVAALLVKAFSVVVDLTPLAAAEPPFHTMTRNTVEETTTAPNIKMPQRLVIMLPVCLHHQVMRRSQEVWATAKNNGRVGEQEMVEQQVCHSGVQARTHKK